MNPPVILRAVIVDDEAPAREILRELLSAHPNVEIIGEANSAASAIALCRDLRPDVVFLDVHMPDGDGFSVLRRLEPLPAIIFVTAYDEHAVRAFEVNAVDYVLKPPSGKRLAMAIHRILFAEKPRPPKAFLQTDQVILKSDTTARVAFVPEVSGIEAEGNYTQVRLIDGDSIFMRRSMSEWEDMLPDEMFFRPHRSLIVNLRAVRKVDWEKRDANLFVVAGFPTPIKLGRQAANGLRRAIREPKML